MKALPGCSLRFWGLLTLLVVVPAWPAAADPQQTITLPAEVSGRGGFGTAPAIAEEGMSRPISGSPSLSSYTTGDVAEFEVTGNTRGNVWGTVVYTSDSNLATAAVHAGVLKDGETGRIKVTLLPGRQSYEGSSRHGVSSRDYGPWAQSYWIERAAEQQPTSDLRSLRGQFGHVITLETTGRTGGSLWGAEAYTDDSDIGTAAVHAGVLADGQTGQVQITILPGRSQYSGSERNGVVSRSYGSWGGSFWIEPAGSQREAVVGSRREANIPIPQSY